MIFKKFFALFFVLGVLLTLSSCALDELLVGNFVFFETDGGTDVAYEFVKEGDDLVVPEAPTKTGFIFSGWYKDEARTQVYNFEYDSITSETTLYAKFKEKTDFNQTFKILSIGNSFSEDAHRYLWSIAESYGIPDENIVIANMYIGGSELYQHVTNIAQNNPAYSYQLYVGATKTDTASMTLEQAIVAEDWDVVTMQQVSQNSGVESSYADYVSRVSAFIEDKATNANVQIAWHMTWAYQQTSSHSGFKNYSSDQMTMYQAIVDVLSVKVDTISQINYIIPSGTAIQNARTSYIGDLLTRDGFHLSDPLGRFIAGLTFFKAITGFEVSPSTIAFTPTGISETLQLLAMESVNNAIKSPRSITQSTYTTEPESEIIEVNGNEFIFDYVQGFWGSGATSVSPESDALHNSFVAVMPIPKYLLPTGSEITIAEGYQYRVIFFTKTDDVYKVAYRTGLYQTSYLEIDEEFWGNYDYVGFNIASNPYSDISARLDEVAGKLNLYHPEGTGAGHVDTELSWTSGTWVLNGNSIETDLNVLSSNPLTPAYYNNDTVIEVSEGYQIALVVLNYDLGLYRVESISSYQTDPFYVDEAFAEGKPLIAFMVTSVSGAEDLSLLNPSEIISTHPKNVIHYDSEITYISGYWETGKTSITTTNSNMDFLNKYAASQPQSKQNYSDVTTLTIEDGYQIRVVFLSYDGYGTYTVLSRSNWTTGSIEMDDAFWGDNLFIAFNISTNPTTDLSSLLDSLPSKFSYATTPMLFTLGYWNTGGSSLVSSTSYAGSNVIPRQFLPSGTVVTVEDGYQIRVIFLSYNGVDGVKVERRTENFVGTFTINNGFYLDDQYIAFNISTTPTTNLTEVLEELPSKLTIAYFDDVVVEHVDQDLSFTVGYWNNYAIGTTTGDTAFIKGFGASNVLSKDYFDGYTQLTIAEGYQIRVIYLDYSYNQYSVILRSANFTGTITLDDAFWGDYEYVAFNISTVPSSDLSNDLATLPTKLTFS